MATDPLIWRSSIIQLPNRGRLWSLQKNHGTPAFCHAATATLRSTRPVLAGAAQRILVENAVSKSTLARLGCIPISDTGQISDGEWRQLLTQLTELGFLHLKRGQLTECVAIPSLSPHQHNAAALDALMTASRCRTIAQIGIDVLRKLNILSWDGAIVPSRHPFITESASIPFSAHAYSYLNPLMEYVEGRRNPLPVVIDAWTTRATEDMVNSLLRRHAKCRHHRKRRVLPVIVAPSLAKDAHDIAKSSGILVVSLTDHFSDALLSAIHQFSHLYAQTSATEPAIQDISHLSDQIQSSDSPYISDLRGLSLEVVVALYFQQRSGDTRLSFKVPFGESSRDIDVLAISPPDVTIIECKAKSHSISPSEDERRKFVYETVPAARDWVRGNLKPLGLREPRFRAELWSTGKPFELLEGFESLPRGVEWASIDLNKMQMRLESIPKLHRLKELVKAIAHPRE